jgi:hypothetical protein
LAQALNQLPSGYDLGLRLLGTTAMEGRGQCAQIALLAEQRYFYVPVDHGAPMKTTLSLVSCFPVEMIFLLNLGKNLFWFLLLGPVQNKITEALVYLLGFVT